MCNLEVCVQRGPISKKFIGREGYFLVANGRGFGEIKDSRGLAKKRGGGE